MKFLDNLLKGNSETLQILNIRTDTMPNFGICKNVVSLTLRLSNPHIEVNEETALVSNLRELSAHLEVLHLECGSQRPEENGNIFPQFPKLKRLVDPQLGFLSRFSGNEESCLPALREFEYNGRNPNEYMLREITTSFPSLSSVTVQETFENYAELRRIFPTVVDLTISSGDGRVRESHMESIQTALNFLSLKQITFEQKGGSSALLLPVMLRVLASNAEREGGLTVRFSLGKKDRKQLSITAEGLKLCIACPGVSIHIKAIRIQIDDNSM